MSNMTKFLRQNCVYTPRVLDEHGDPVLDMYGVPSYGTPQNLFCRREQTTKDVQTMAGSILRSEYKYYLDNSLEPKLEDCLDGRPILTISEYVDGCGICIGYECRT